MKQYKPELSNISPHIEMGKDCIVHSHVVIYDNVKIGDRVKIQAFVFIPNGITIGDDVFIGPRVTFTNDPIPPSGGKGWKETSIKDGVSIGAAAVILPGIVIGRNAMVGAGSVVTKNIPQGEVWIGNPARFYKKRIDL